MRAVFVTIVLADFHRAFNAYLTGQGSYSAAAAACPSLTPEALGAWLDYWRMPAASPKDLQDAYFEIAGADGRLSFAELAAEMRHRAVPAAKNDVGQEKENRNRELAMIARMGRVRRRIKQLEGEVEELTELVNAEQGQTAKKAALQAELKSKVAALAEARAQHGSQVTAVEESAKSAASTRKSKTEAVEDALKAVERVDAQAHQHAPDSGSPSSREAEEEDVQTEEDLCWPCDIHDDGAGNKFKVKNPRFITDEASTSTTSGSGSDGTDSPTTNSKPSRRCCGGEIEDFFEGIGRFFENLFKPKKNP